MFIIRRFRPTEDKSSERNILASEESIKRAEQVTHIQGHLNRLANEGRYEEFVQYATGVYPADVAADRRIMVR